MLAYIRADPKENPEVVTELTKRLAAQNIKPIVTRLPWQEIIASEPFLYYRNPYLRYPREADLLRFHGAHDFLFLRTTDEEVISVKPNTNSKAFFVVNCQNTYYKPTIPPLPILIGLHQRLEYAKLTLNSLLHSLQGETQQKIYLSLSQPSPEIVTWVKNLLERYSQIEAVSCQENLGLSLFKWGSQYFDLKSFIHWEDDGLLPEGTRYLLPYWTRQIAYRAQTADLAGFRVSEENQTSWLQRQKIYRTESTYLKFDPETIWNYFIPNPTDLPPISGNGLVIETDRHYRGIGAFTSDLSLYRKAKSVCLANIPVYHIGANHLMDYGNKQPAPLATSKDYSGVDLRSGVVRVVQL